MMQRAILIGAFLLAGLLGFWLTLNWVPGFIMSRATERVTASGASINLATHVPPVDETSRGVVRPSPDILYSICPFDVSDVPLLIEVPWPEDGSYASLSFYDANSNNFAVISDRDVEADFTTVSLAHRFESYVPGEADRNISSPTQTGIALFRRIVGASGPTETTLQERAAFRCGPLAQ
tara:strand:+ start:22418 stop:22954 length:537 start_codon:yes stop_codon:yes gene_type:complete